MSEETDEAFLSRMGTWGTDHGRVKLSPDDYCRFLTLATRGTAASRNGVLEEAAKVADRWLGAAVIADAIRHLKEPT
jgi:hypothetical protein